MSSTGINKRLPNNSSSSSGSDLEQIEKKRLRRKESNRESARRSRQRKQHRLEELVSEVARLTTENDEYARKISELTHGFVTADTQNAVLRAEKERLVSGLESLQQQAAMPMVETRDELILCQKNHHEFTAGMMMMAMPLPWSQQQKQPHQLSLSCRQQ